MFNFKRISIIVAVLILLPSVFFTIVQLNSMNETEKEIELIYKNRLNTVVFSVNQFSEDLVNSWKSVINSALAAPEPQLSGKLGLLVQNETSVSAMYFTGFEGNVTAKFKSEASPSFSDSLVVNLLAENSKIIRRLKTYKEEDYYKNEPLGDFDDNITALVFLTSSEIEKYQIAILMLNAEEFVRGLLSPKIQEISGQDLQISVTKSTSGRVITATNDARPEEADLADDLWLFKDYSINISIKGVSISDLVNARLYTNLGLLLLLNIFIIGGAVFLYVSVKKQVEITQIKSDFVSNVSHELRTPLALISMFAETLEMGRVRTEEKKQEYYTIINKEAGRLSRIVNKILNFSKMEAGKRTYNFTQNNVNFLIEEILSTYSFHLKNKGFDYSFEKDESLPDQECDGEAITEAVINLIDNAIKYSSDTKKIEISTSFSKGNVAIDVKDYGIGIADKDKKRIFEKFYRVSTGLVHNTKGTGLGLSLVKHIVDAHNGEIIIESEPGKGTTFTLLLPLKVKSGELKNA